jgi:hypothetical protein
MSLNENNDTTTTSIAVQQEDSLKDVHIDASFTEQNENINQQNIQINENEGQLSISQNECQYIRRDMVILSFMIFTVTLIILITIYYEQTVENLGLTSSILIILANYFMISSFIAIIHGLFKEAQYNDYVIINSFVTHKVDPFKCLFCITLILTIVAFSYQCIDKCLTTNVLHVVVLIVISLLCIIIGVFVVITLGISVARFLFSFY